MSLKITLTITVTNPDSNQQYQAKDAVLSYDPEVTPHDVMEKALTFLREELDSPRLPLEDPDADPAAMSDEEWEASVAEPEPANA